jgi:hypothetical protein
MKTRLFLAIAASVFSIGSLAVKSDCLEPIASNNDPKE